MQSVKNRSGCNCCGVTSCGVVTGTVYVCCTPETMAGVTVELRQTNPSTLVTSTVSTSTTAADGSFTLPFYANGFAQVRASHAALTTVTYSVSGPLGGNLSCTNPGPYTSTGSALQDNGTTKVCICGKCAATGPCAAGPLLMPATLYLSDGSTTITLPAVGNSWTTCVNRSVSGYASTVSGGSKVCTTPGTITVPVTYRVTCSVSGFMSLRVSSPSCSVGGSFHMTTGSCGDINASYDDTAVPTSCSPVACTFSTGVAASGIEDLYPSGTTFTLSE